MRDLYATTVRLVHLGDGDAYEVACERAMKWAWRSNGMPPDLAQKPSGENHDVDTGIGVIWSSTVTASARAFEVRLMHPDGEDHSMRWNATVTISEVDKATRATVRLGMEATVHSLRPWRVELRAPSIVKQFMQPPLLSYAGSIELHAGPVYLGAADMPSFLSDVLKADDRALPVLIVSSEVASKLAEAFDRALCGLIQVVQLQDETADEELRKTLSPSGYTVPRGGLRMFWPGFGSNDAKQRQPYWTAAQLRQGRRSRRRSVVARLIDLLAPISTGRVPVDPGVLSARRRYLEEESERQRARNDATRERARRNREEAKRAKREARELAAADGGQRLEERLSDVEALLDIAEGERDSALKMATKSKDEELRAIEDAMEHSERAQLLEIENRNLRDNLVAITQFEDEGDEENVDDDLPSEVESWTELAEFLSELSGPGFHLTDRALACADGSSRYPHPDAMWRALRALEKVGRAYNEMGAELGMRFEQFAWKLAGIDVALQDNEYPDCWFEYEEEWYQRLPHVKIDEAKPPNEVGRIYFALDSTGRRVIVDWFGTKPDRPHTRRSSVAAAG